MLESKLTLSIQMLMRQRVKVHQKIKLNQTFFLAGQLTEDDEKLLEDETASPANLKR